MDFDYEVEREGFTVDSDVRANWCLKKIKDEQDEAQRLKDIIRAERDQLLAKEQEIDKRLADKTGFLKGKLYEYFGKVEHKATKTQETYKLLDGSLVYKKPSKKIVKPEDDAELIKYLEETEPELVETVKKPLWGEFKKLLHVTDDGKVIDTSVGVELDFIKAEDSEASFEVKV